MSYAETPGNYHLTKQAQNIEVQMYRVDGTRITSGISASATAVDFTVPPGPTVVAIRSLDSAKWSLARK